eukprot:gene11499-21716_t
MKQLLKPCTERKEREEEATSLAMYTDLLTSLLTKEIKLITTCFVEDKSLKPIKAIDDGEYLAIDEFEKHSKHFLSSLNEDGSLEGKYEVISKDLIKLVVSQGIYDGRFRTTLKTFTSALEVDWEEIDHFEQSLVEELVKIRSDEEQREKRRQTEQQKRNLKRAFVIGLTAVGGGAILALSAGLAAPLIGAGAVAVLGSGSAAIFTGASGLAVITSIFGAAGASLAGYKMTKRIGKIEQFEFGSLSNGKHLHVALAVSGFCGSDDNDAGFSVPWEALGISTEQYYLKWEGKYLRNLGSSIIDFVKREAMQAAVKGILKYTALRAVLKSIAWPLTLISAANLIDNPWNVCTQRAKETGIHLAHGYRPITLIGFSLGARVIFYCLQTMLNEKGYEGIIEDVVLIGAPVGVSCEEWEALEAVISGKLYNCYSRSDWLLKFVYRAASVQVGDIAGLGPIEVSWPRLVNIDLTDVVNSHSEYAEPTVIHDVLQLIGYKTNPVETATAATAVKMPQDYVKEISKTPTKILPQSFPLPGKDAKPQQPLEELTAEEQETLDRLTSCQTGTVIDSLKNKGGFWKNDDSGDAENSGISDTQSSKWGKVVSITMRSSLARNRKMIEAGNVIQKDDQSLQSEDTSCLHEVTEQQDISYSECNDGDVSKSSCPKGEVSDMDGELKYTDAVQGGNEVRNTNQPKVTVGLSKSIDSQVLSRCGNEETIEDSKTGDALMPKDSSKEKMRSGTLSLPSFHTRTERSKSAGDIKTNLMKGNDIRDITESPPTETKKDSIKIPGRELFSKVCKNVKFALPSPTLSRHKKSTEKESSGDQSKDTENPDSSTFPGKAFRKMSFPGSY